MWFGMGDFKAFMFWENGIQEGVCDWVGISRLEVVWSVNRVSRIVNSGIERGKGENITCRLELNNAEEVWA